MGWPGFLDAALDDEVTDAWLHGGGEGSFRATGITAYLDAGDTLENAQAMATHGSPRTTKLYDRTGDEINGRGRAHRDLTPCLP